MMNASDSGGIMKERVRMIGLFLIKRNPTDYLNQTENETFKNISNCFSRDIYDKWFIELIKKMIDKNENLRPLPS